jgi:hypothetical protein
MLLFKKLLIFAVFNETEVFVPALLRRLRSEEIDVHRAPCSSSAASPLVLTFPKHGGPLLGVFCASVVALLSEDNIHPCPWNLKLEKDKITPSCLYRNCVQFKVPGYTESIVVIDSFEYIEVHVHTRAESASELETFATFCGTIRNGIIQAVRKATIALNYDYHEPSLCFGCPCDHPVFHTATIGADKTRWICSRDEYDKVLVANQRIWLKEEKDTVSHTPVENKPLPLSVALALNQQAISLSSHTPVFHELDLLERHGKKLKLIQRISSKWERVATRLYFPADAIEVISRDYRDRCDPACRTMLSRWLNGEGRVPRTWGTLVTALYEADLSSVANELEKMISCAGESEHVSREQHRMLCQVL